LGNTLAWFVFHRRTLPFSATPSTERTALVEPQEESLPGGWLLRAGPYLILAVTGLSLYLNFDRLPDPSPTHFGIRGADHLQPKSYAVVFRSLAILSLVCAMLGVNAKWLASRNYTRRVRLQPGDRRENRFHRMQLVLLLGAQYLMAMMNAWMSLALRGPYAVSEPWGVFGGIALVLVFVPVAIYVALRYGQGGWRLPGSTLAVSKPPIGDQTPDQCWKLGQFCFNSDDPALWVEKRSGIGYTLNFARPLSWVWILSAVAGPVLLVRLFSS
jgi:uncharacterized membrane protein